MRVPGMWWWFCLLIVMQLASCSKDRPAEAGGSVTDSTSPAVVSDTPLARLDAGITASLPNLAYGSDSREKMDLNLVAGRNANTPFVVLLHGGSWSEGDKKDLQSQAAYFFSQGINVANVNYRLTNSTAGSVRWRGILSDVGGAISFLNRNADSLQTRKNAFVIFGFSAGAHLALLHAYSYDSNNLVSAVIGFGTPTKFNDSAWRVNPFLAVARQALPPLTGQSFAADTSSNVLFTLSPYFSRQLKPTLLIHGDKDNVVPWSQSALMFARLKSTGTQGSFISLAHSGHAGEGASQADLNKALLAGANWIKNYSR